MHKMNVTIKFGTDHIDWREVCLIFERAPLGKREPEKLRRAALNSHIVCSAYDSDTIVGFGRAISDGEYQSAIYDVVVMPEYQGQGVGRTIMESLLQHLPKGPVLIYAVLGKEGFYRKIGFGDLKTGMGLFPNPEKARSNGYLV
jgi:ribosomal protein S18 acetylase RimI-like enzyme